MRRSRWELGAKFRTPWTIRLNRELEDLKALQAESTILEMQVEGDPPDRYVFTFHGKSLIPSKDDGVAIGDKQQVEIKLGTDYPRRAPQVNWLTPIVHPNISGHSVCLGNFLAHWNPNVRLADVAEILWDLERFAIFNPHSAYSHGGGMSWKELDEKYGFPVDQRPLRDKKLPNDVGSSELRPEGGENDIVILADDESACQFLE